MLKPPFQKFQTQNNNLFIQIVPEPVEAAVFVAGAVGVVAIISAKNMLHQQTLLISTSVASNHRLFWFHLFTCLKKFRRNSTLINGSIFAFDIETTGTESAVFASKIAFIYAN